MAQNLELDDVFPKLKKIKDKNIDLEGCVTGDCTGGKGIYMTVQTTSTTSRSNAADFTSVTVYIFNGEFSENGEMFNGKEFGLNTKYYENKKKLEPAFTGLIDASDNELDPFLSFEGEFGKREELNVSFCLSRVFFVGCSSGFLLSQAKQFCIRKNGYLAAFGSIIHENWHSSPVLSWPDERETI